MPRRKNWTLIIILSKVSAADIYYDGYLKNIPTNPSCLSNIFYTPPFWYWMWWARYWLCLRSGCGCGRGLPARKWIAMPSEKLCGRHFAYTRTVKPRCVSQSANPGSINTDVFNGLLTVCVDPLIARLCASRGVKCLSNWDGACCALFCRIKRWQIAKPLPGYVWRMRLGAGVNPDCRRLRCRRRDGVPSVWTVWRRCAAKWISLCWTALNIGYGLTPRTCRNQLPRGAWICWLRWITVSPASQAWRGTHGVDLDVIVTDHHLPADTVPGFIHRQSGPKRLRFPKQKLGGRGRDFCCVDGVACRTAPPQLFSDGLKEPNLGDLWIWSHSARLPMSSLSTTTTASPRVAKVWNGCVRATCALAHPRALFEVARARSARWRSFVSIWVLRWACASMMPPDGWTICRSASPACWREMIPKLRNWRLS